MNNYVGFAFSDSMIPDNLNAYFSSISVEEMKEFINTEEYISVCNPSHQATIVALKEKFDISINIPGRAPKVLLKKGDILYILKPNGIPRLEGRNEYTQKEVDNATFVFRKVIIC